MDIKSLNKLWGISLMVIGVVTLIIVGSSIAGIVLTDAAKRILGVIDLIALPVFVYASVRKFKIKA